MQGGCPLLADWGVGRTVGHERDTAPTYSYPTSRRRAHRHKRRTRNRLETLVADGGIPNKHRADSALTIYRDAMRQYIASILEREHGPNWFRSEKLTLSDAQQRRALQSGSPVHGLIDLADIPFLIDDNRSAFPTLDRTDVAWMHTVRDLRNSIHHFHGEGDCTREQADAIVGLCVLVLERCGLSDAVESIRSLSAAEPASPAPETDSQKERARREWDKGRLSRKPDEELTALERQRLDDIAWEEEWERREQERWEQERLEQERREHRAREILRGEKLSAGKFHNLGLREDGAVVGWGYNGGAQCDAPAGKFIAVSAGGSHSLGLREDGTVVGWGGNCQRQCDTPAGKFVDMGAGEFHSLGLREDGTVAGWGSNQFGQCAAPAEKFVAVSAGGYHSLGLREDGTVVGWGDNGDGQCDVLVGKFTAVSAGRYHSLGLREDGTVAGWGDNGDGQCDAPVGKFAAVSAGTRHSLGLREDGTVIGWGSNGYRQCDAPDGKFVAVSAGWFHSLGLREDGTVVGWGRNDDSQCDAPRGLQIL